jgi:quaternary ammonium compound-resistance protein SugE
MSWTILIVAGLLEIGWAVGLKLSDGLSKPLPAVLTVIAMIASMVLLGIAVRTLPLGTAYAVWTGIGAVGSVLLGIVLFQEPATAGRLLCVAAIVGGIVGLKLLTPTAVDPADAVGGL